MIGLSVELKYPNQRKNATTWSLNVQDLKIAMSRARMKKGSQQAMKAPVTMANVLAAFRSLFASRDTCFFSLVEAWFCLLFTFTLCLGLPSLRDNVFGAVKLELEVSVWQAWLWYCLRTDS